MRGFIIVAVLGVAALTVMAGVGLAAPKPVKQLTCFTGQTEDPSGIYGGKCSISKGVATIDTTAVGNPAYVASYAGVYVPNTPSLSGKKIGDVGQLGFTYTGGPTSGGSPRFSVPIDTDADGAWDSFAFVDTTCDDEGTGTVDVIGDATCPTYIGSEAFPSWASFVAAHPEYRIASDTPAFVIADQPYSGTISNVKLGRAATK
jgi:hypothetical protein